MFVPCANIQRLELAEALTRINVPVDRVVTASTPDIEGLTPE
jgi:hypothetical protein